ncbi:MAG: DUF3531 family protein [Prochlorotrichaceae cyanobacterium]|jgi:hypothetical protein
MYIEFREVNPFDLWLWVEFPTVPSTVEQQYVEELLSSWFYLGKLGGFNEENLQVQETGIDLSYLDYDHDVAESSLMAVMHNMGEMEYEGTWGRCWFDLGTSDALALDVLINAFHQLSRDYVSLDRLIIGGENEDWPVPHEDDRDTFYDQN